MERTRAVGRRAGARPPKIYRGSRRRLRRISIRDSGSWELWVLLAWLLFILAVVLPRIARHG